MGNLCSCCPFVSDTQSQPDSLSKVSTMTVNGQIEKVTFKGRGQKKLDKHAEIELKRQQSRFFKKNALFESQLINKENPFIYSSRKDIALKYPKEEHAAYFSRVKEKIKYKTNKNSTTDEDDSVGEYYLERQQIESHCEEQDIRTPVFGNRALGRGNSSPIKLNLMGNEQKGQKLDDNVQEIVKLEGRVSEGSLQGNQLFVALTILIESKLELKEYADSQKYLKKALEMIADQEFSRKDELRLSIYYLAGVHYLHHGQSSQALDYLLKAMRIEISSQGTESTRLVQIYFWLAEVYYKIEKFYLAKNYYSKAYRLYIQHRLTCPQLLATICLKLGGFYVGESQFAEADRFFGVGMKAAEQSGNAGTYVQTLISSAENSYHMDNVRHYIAKYIQLFKVVHKYKMEESIIRQAVSSLCKNRKQLIDSNLTKKELDQLLAAISLIALEFAELEQLKQSLRESNIQQ